MKSLALFAAGLLDGVSIEAMEVGPESQQRKAMNAWKP